MANKIEILQNRGDWFLAGKYPISYRLVILKCFYDDIKGNKLNQTSFGFELSKAVEYLQDLPTESFKGDYFSIYQFNDCSGSPAVFFVDHKHIYFPLVFYSNKNTTAKKGFRLGALLHCLSHIHKNDNALFDLLKKSDEWDESFQKKILELIPEPLDPEF